MSLSNDQITAKNFKAFYEGIRPYLNGAAHSGFTPIGTVISVMGNSAPLNYLVCDGTVYNIADYPELAQYFYQQFEASNYFGGDGTTTFAVPDLRGEFLRGTGTNSHTDQGSGATVGTHQDGTVHPYVIEDNSVIQLNLTTNSASVDPVKNADVALPRKKWVTATRENSGTTTNNKGAYTSRPTNTSVLYCIATKNIFVDAGSNYSADEMVIGTWIDGKPIYQKTIDCGALPNATNKKVAHNISNLGMIVNYFGIAYNPTASEYQAINKPGISSSTYGISIIINGANISIDTGTDRRAFTTSYVTLQYTKTSN